jgi:hypothetical protein
VYYIFKPIIPIKIVRWLMYVTGASLFLIGLFFPGKVEAGGGLVLWLCQIGQSVPIVGSLDISKKYTCALYASFGAAVYFGYFIGFLLCFCKLDKPIQIEQIMTGAKAGRLAAFFVVLSFVAGTWLISSPPQAGGWFRLISFSRLSIAVGAIGYFFANCAMWVLIFCFFKNYFGVRDVRN